MTTSGIGIETSVNEIEAFCKKCDIVEMSLFGSVLRDGFSPASDIDILVTFSDEARHGLFAMARMRNGLENVLQRSNALLYDILESAKLAVAYLQGITKGEFQNGVQLQDDVIRAQRNHWRGSSAPIGSDENVIPHPTLAGHDRHAQFSDT